MERGLRLVIWFFVYPLPKTPPVFYFSKFAVDCFREGRGHVLTKREASMKRSEPNSNSKGRRCVFACGVESFYLFIFPRYPRIVILLRKWRTMSWLFQGRGNNQTQSNQPFYCIVSKASFKTCAWSFGAHNSICTRSQQTHNTSTHSPCLPEYGMLWLEMVPHKYRTSNNDVHERLNSLDSFSKVF